MLNKKYFSALRIKTKQFHYLSLYPNGYNLNSGGTTFRATLESRRRVSKGVYQIWVNILF